MISFYLIFNVYFLFQVQVFYVKANKYALNQLALLESGISSDVVIDVNGTEIPAHKAFLSAQSPVFRAMFIQKDTLEAQENRVKIADVDIGCMRELLRFIYTGAKPEDGAMTTDLLVLADRVCT